MGNSKNILKRRVRSSYFDANWKEIPDPTPVALNVTTCFSESSDQKIRRILLENAQKTALESGMDSYEEANDFDVQDDFDSPEIESQYQLMEYENPYVEEQEISPPHPKDGGENSQVPDDSSADPSNEEKIPPVAVADAVEKESGST